MRAFVRRDLDGFFGLFVDNLVQLLLIVGLCGGLCGMSGANAHYLYKRILPGAAVSIVIGNLFYARQALRLARRERRDDVTALPYGINTPSLLIYLFFVMAPVYGRTHSVETAWRMGLLACLGSGIIEFTGAFVAERIRRHTPRAALLSTLAWIAIGFISMTFALQIWTRPLVTFVPMALVLVTYFSGVSFPIGLPGGLIAIVAGTALAWLLPASWTGVAMQSAQVSAAAGTLHLVTPTWYGGVLWSTLCDWREWLPFVSVIVPMGLFNLIGSLQNIESAEAGGDRFDTRASLAVNGIGTTLACLFGSCFPTTIYIGHPGWKALGARAGYSTLNGVLITLICLSGAVGLVSRVIPIEAGIPIVLWIGIVITAQAFSATPREHAPAVAMGLFPAIAAWGATVVMGAFAAAGGKTLQEFLVARPDGEVNGFLVHGMIVMERGYIFTCMVIAAISAHLIDRRFVAAAAWSGVGAMVTAAGLCNAYQVRGNVVDYLLAFASPGDSATTFAAHGLAVAYVLMAVVFGAIGMYVRAAEGAAHSTGDHG